MKLADFLQSEGKLLKKQKGAYVFRQGEHSGAVYVVRSGLLKATYLNEDGKVFIKSFITEGDLVTSLTSVYGHQPCSFSLYCIEACQLIELNFQRLYDQSQSQQDMAQDMIAMLLNFAMKKEQREYELLCLSAEDRYSKMRTAEPHLLKKITQNDLAAYLGVTPVGLSRIRKRVEAG